MVGWVGWLGYQNASRFFKIRQHVLFLLLLHCGFSSSSSSSTTPTTTANPKHSALRSDCDNDNSFCSSLALIAVRRGNHEMIKHRNATTTTDCRDSARQCIFVAFNDAAMFVKDWPAGSQHCHPIRRTFGRFRADQQGRLVDSITHRNC